MGDDSAGSAGWAKGRKEINTSNDKVLTRPRAKTERPFLQIKREEDGKRGASKLMRAQVSSLTVCSVSSNVT